MQVSDEFQTAGPSFTPLLSSLKEPAKDLSATLLFVPLDDEQDAEATGNGNDRSSGGSGTNPLVTFRYSVLPGDRTWW